MDPVSRWLHLQKFDITEGIASAFGKKDAAIEGFRQLFDLREFNKGKALPPDIVDFIKQEQEILRALQARRETRRPGMQEPIIEEALPPAPERPKFEIPEPHQHKPRNPAPLRPNRPEVPDGILRGPTGEPLDELGRRLRDMTPEQRNQARIPGRERLFPNLDFRDQIPRDEQGKPLIDLRPKLEPRPAPQPGDQSSMPVRVKNDGDKPLKVEVVNPDDALAKQLAGFAGAIQPVAYRPPNLAALAGELPDFKNLRDQWRDLVPTLPEPFGKPAALPAESFPQVADSPAARPLEDLWSWPAVSRFPQASPELAGRARELGRRQAMEPIEFNFPPPQRAPSGTEALESIASQIAAAGQAGGGMRIDKFVDAMNRSISLQEEANGLLRSMINRMDQNTSHTSRRAGVSPAVAARDFNRHYEPV
jgi:hypothetical protein